MQDEQNDDKRPELTRENLIVNELIREYLHYNRYHSTCSVLLTGTASVRNLLNNQQKFVTVLLKIAIFTYT